MTTEHHCPVCRDDRWVSFTRNIGGKNYPWAAACLRERGMLLSADREHHPKSGGAWGRPVVVQPIDRDIYNERLRQGAEPPAERYRADVDA